MNKRFHWLEAKQLDRVTNFSTEIEPIKFALSHNIEAFYYCTFAKNKKYYGLKHNIKYLGILKNKYLKHVEFQILVVIKAISIVLTESESVLMVNQGLIRHMLPALTLNNLLKRKNKFVSDIRTTPTSPKTFDQKMKTFHKQFQYAIKYFDGFSFITPFMEKYVMSSYENRDYKIVNWSSGVDLDQFNPYNYISNRPSGKFRLFYHGGISLSRGNLNLIKAAHLLVKAGYEIELLQVGILVDKEIKDYCEAQNISSWCKILPPVPLTAIPQMIADCDLPVLPFPNFMAWRVSSPIKMMEYLAMGKKLLVPNMEAFTNVFKETPQLCFYYDVHAINPIEEISNAIKVILDENFLGNNNFFKEARDFVGKSYSWDKQAANLFDFCNKL